MKEDIRIWSISILVVIAVFIINLILNVTSAKAQDAVTTFINENRQEIVHSYIQTRENFLLCTKNPKFPSCPISKVIPQSRLNH